MRAASLGAAAVVAALVLAGGAPPRVGAAGAGEIRLAGVAPEPAVARATATWCGAASQADRRPNVVAGQPAKWVYALPADGVDALATWGSAMQTDAEAIDVWWRAQDTTRTPRNDLAQFACGAQLDIATLRFPQPGQVLTGGGRFNAIANGLQAAGHSSPFTKYVVYYDGPVADDQVCGQGGSDRSGFGLAVVFVQACAGVSTAAVAAHELLHALGAVGTGAPHGCTGESDGHVCDDTRDLMYPFIDRSPLASKLLDPARDDYYGHAGAWADTRRSPWLVQLDAQAPLALTLAGPGVVSADVPGLDCAATCTTTWNAGTRLTLTPAPRPGAKLVRWRGGCSGAARCTVTVGQTPPVSAFFAPATYRLAVGVAGQGTVRSSRGGISCRPRCAAPVSSHVPVTLTARAAQGWRFRAWTGACRGPRPVCTLPMTGAAQAHAVFARVRR